jgi:hypothetical protein
MHTYICIISSNFLLLNICLYRYVYLCMYQADGVRRNPKHETRNPQAGPETPPTTAVQVMEAHIFLVYVVKLVTYNSGQVIPRQLLVLCDFPRRFSQPNPEVYQRGWKTVGTIHVDFLRHLGGHEEGYRPHVLCRFWSSLFTWTAGYEADGGVPRVRRRTKPETQNPGLKPQIWA